MNRPEKRTRPLPVDGLDRALREGRRRRHRAVGTTGGGLTAAVVLVTALSLLGSSSGPQSLDTANDPTPTATASDSAGAERTTEPTPDPQGASPAASEHPSCQDGGECYEEPEPDCINNDCYENDDGPPAPQLEQARPAYTEAPQERLDDGSCYARGSRPISDGAICLDVTGPDTVRQGEDLVVEVLVCAPSTGGPVTLRYPGGGEQDLVVEEAYDGEFDGSADPGREVWAFSGSVRFTGGAHERTLLPRQCLVYSRAWPTVDEYGLPVQQGDYFLRGYSLADALNGVAWPRGDQGPSPFRVTVTE